MTHDARFDGTARGDATATVDCPDDPDALLGLLCDEYTREILTVLGDEALATREVAERADVSRPTAHRRLTRLADLGVLETSIEIRGDGHHRTQFEVALDAVEVSLADDALAVDLVPGSGTA